MKVAVIDYPHAVNESDICVISDVFTNGTHLVLDGPGVGGIRRSKYRQFANITDRVQQILALLVLIFFNPILFIGFSECLAL